MMKILFLVLVSTVSYAAELLYLSPSSVTPQDVPPVPQHGSLIYLQDMQSIMQMQAQRTPADCRRAQATQAINIYSYYAAPYGPLTAMELEKAKNLFAKVKSETSYFTGGLKKFFRRMRPYDANPQVRPCVAKVPDFAYPSGHAAGAFVTSEVMALLFPAKTQALRARALEIAWDRVRAGVHHPSDLEAARLEALKVLSELAKSQRFLSDLREAQAGR